MAQKSHLTKVIESWSSLSESRRNWILTRVVAIQLRKYILVLIRDWQFVPIVPTVPIVAQLPQIFTTIFLVKHPSPTFSCETSFIRDWQFVPVHTLSQLFFLWNIVHSRLTICASCANCANCGTTTLAQPKVRHVHELPWLECSKIKSSVHYLCIRNLYLQRVLRGPIVVSLVHDVHGWIWISDCWRLKRHLRCSRWVHV
jgi:hypothetical protein